MKKLLVLLALHSSLFTLCNAQYTVLHNFQNVSNNPTPGNTNGAEPNGALTLYNGLLYGMTSYGGSFQMGCIFSIHTDGSGYTDLLDFDGNPSTPGYGYGGRPVGNLTLSGGIFYGTTIMNPACNTCSDTWGTVFSFNPGTNTYTDLLTFDGYNGGCPYGNLTVSGNMIYGTGECGGQGGVVFSLHTDGSHYKQIYTWYSYNYYSLGDEPLCTLTLSGRTLYGILNNGGANHIGFIFAVDTSGSNYRDIYDFSGATGYPLNSSFAPALTLIGKRFYASLDAGGPAYVYNSYPAANGYGVIFSIDTTGTGYTVLHYFNDTLGSYPTSVLTLSGSVFYGTTANGGTYGEGTLFSIDTNGSAFTDLHNLRNIDYNCLQGHAPYGGLVISGNTAYGMTAYGGTTSNFQYYLDGNGGGVIFSDNIACPEIDVTFDSVVNINEKCSGNLTGSAKANATGGVTPYTYSWSPSGITTAIATGLSAGTYTVTITDNNGCNNSNNCDNSVIILPGLTITGVSGTNLLCNGVNSGAAVVTAIGGTSPYTYLWSDLNSQTTATANWLSAGSYTITVTDSCGASATASINLTQPATAVAITIASNTNVNCNGGTNGSATANAASGGIPFVNVIYGNISTVAGTGGYGYNGDGIAATSAELYNDLGGITMDGSGNIYIADFSNQRVRKINTSGIISTVAGNGTGGYNGDGIAATSAELGDPTCVAVDGSGNIYIVDYYNNRIRKVTTSGIISTVAGNGYGVRFSGGFSGDGGAATSAELNTPIGVTVDGSGNIYIADAYNNRIRKVNASGIISTIAGNGTGGYNSDGIAATSAELNEPSGIAVDGSGNMYIADAGNARIRKVNVSGTISTVAGNGTLGYNGDGFAATYAELYDPNSVTVDAYGNLFIADFLNNRIREVNTSGIISTVAGNGTQGYNSDGIAATSAELNRPTIVAIDASNNLFINDGGNSRVRKVAASINYYTYFWSPAGGNNLTASNLNAGTYTVIATDLNGCNGTATVTITQPNALTISGIVSNNTGCSGVNNGTANVSISGGTAPYTYSWSNGATTTPVSGLSWGGYTVTVSDSCGSSVTASVTVGNISIISAFVVSNVSCNGGSNGSGSVSLNGGTTPYTYSWSDPDSQTTPTAIALSAGTYTITVMDSCSATAAASIIITQPDILSISNTIVNNNVSCNGGSNGSASVSASGGTTPYTYLWSDPNTQTTSTAAGLSAGTYTITLTDSCGSTTSASVTITQPVQLAITGSSSHNVGCSGISNGEGSVNVSGGTSPYTYLWSDPFYQATDTAKGLSWGGYTVKVTDSCGATATDSITVGQLTITDSATTNVTCSGASNGSATLTASGGTLPYTYLWSDLNSQTTNPATGLSAGAYTITVMDSCGSSATATVTVNNPSQIEEYLSVTNISCNGGNNGAINFGLTGGTPPYTYFWYDNITQFSNSASISGLTASPYYYCIFSDSCGNEYITDNISITQPNPLSITDSSAVNPSNIAGNNGSASVSVSGGTTPYTYLWMWNDQDAPTDTISGLTAGHYVVRVTDSCGNSQTASVTISSSSSELSVTIISQTNILCYGGTGSATANATGGTSPYAYSWPATAYGNIFANGQTYINVAGTYTVTVTDSNGNTATASVTFTQPASPLTTAIYGIVNVSCNTQGQATDSVSGGVPPYTWNWAPNYYGGNEGANWLTAGSLTGGSYTVTVTDSNGCSATAGFTIQPSFRDSVSTQTNVFCNGESNGSATIGVKAGGNTPYNYSWSPSGKSTQAVSGLAAGTYTVTVTDHHGCYNTVPVIITQPSAMRDSVASLTYLGCFPRLGTATIGVTGGTSPYTYLWNPSSFGSVTTVTGLVTRAYEVTVKDNNGCSVSPLIFSVKEPPPIRDSIVTASTVNVLCNGGQNGSASVGVKYGTPPYTYLWSNGAPTQNNVSLLAGVYTLLVTDSNGCNASASVTITQPLSALSITMSSQINVLCYGNTTGSATSRAATGGTSPYTYSWSAGQGTGLSISNLGTGDDTIYATDAHGCTASASVIITQPAGALGVSISSQANVLCYGGRGNATAAASGGTPSYKYSWTGGGGTNTITSSLSAGTYTVTATDANRCPAAVSVTITQPVSPLGITMLSHSNVLCRGVATDSATANSATGGTSPYTYSWTSGGGTNLTAYNFSAGTYSITATDNNGCTAAASVTLTQPLNALSIVMSSQTNVLCNGGTGSATSKPASGGTSPYLYNWSPAGGTNITASNLSAATYSITATDANGCTAMAIVTISQPANPVAISIESQTNISCNGGKGSATANTASGGTGLYKYSWAPSGGTNLTATSLNPGTYTVSASDARGCSATATVTISQPPVLAITMQAHNNIACHGETDSATANPASGGTSPYTYSWSGGRGTNLSAYFTAGTYSITVTDSNGCTAKASVTITQPASALAIAVPTATNVPCNGGVGSASAKAATGGTSPYTYNWTPTGGANLIASGISAGTYTITATDNHGCAVSASVNITQPSSPLNITLLSQVNISCHGGKGSATANAATGGTPNYRYSWSPNGGTNLTASSLSAGAYTITATDAHGCSATAGVNITQPSALSITMFSHSNVLCRGVAADSATANPASGGTSPYTYNWTGGGGTNLTAYNLTAGTYTITATDSNGCHATADVTITQPAAALAITMSSHINVLCNGNSTGSATAKAATGGTSPYTYNWSDGAPGLIASSLSIGTYTITATDAHGCIVTTDVTITQPSVLGVTIAGPTSVLCYGEKAIETATASSGTPAYKYSWSGGATASSVSLGAGTYTVTATDANKCPATASVTISQPTSPLGVTMLSHSNVLCHGVAADSATANAATGGTAPYVYSWSGGGGTNLTAYNFSAGTYTITATDAHLCTATSGVIITQPPTSVSIVIAAHSNVLCNGGSTGSAAGSATGGIVPYLFSWSSGGTNLMASGLSIGTYTLMSTDSHGCSATTSVTITQPAVIEASASISGCSGSSGTAMAEVTGGTTPYTYSWSPGGGTKATMSGLTSGNYTITVKDKNGCTGSTTLSNSCASAPPRNDNSNDNQNPDCCPALNNVNLYPNPNTGQFTISGTEKGMIIEIYDYTGRIISNITASDETMQFNISTRANGIYLVRILSKEGNLVSQKKVVKTQ